LEFVVLIHHLAPVAQLDDKGTRQERFALFALELGQQRRAPTIAARQGSDVNVSNVGRAPEKDLNQHQKFALGQVLVPVYGRYFVLKGMLFEIGQFATSLAQAFSQYVDPPPEVKRHPGQGQQQTVQPAHKPGGNRHKEDLVFSRVDCDKGNESDRCDDRDSDQAPEEHVAAQAGSLHVPATFLSGTRQTASEEELYPCTLILAQLAVPDKRRNQPEH
jgi:hypothetical protein